MQWLLSRGGVDVDVDILDGALGVLHKELDKGCASALAQIDAKCLLHANCMQSNVICLVCVRIVDELLLR